MTTIRPLVIERRGMVADGKAARWPSCIAPQCCVLPSGRWLVAFRGAPTKNSVGDQHTLLTRSDDAGVTWLAPVEPWRPPIRSGRAGAFRAAGLTSLGGDGVLAVLYWVDVSDPDRPFFNEATEGLLDSRIMLSRSHDGGLTWSEPEYADTAPFDIPTPTTGPVLKMPDGQLVLQFETNKHYDDPEPWRHKSVLMFSTDGGRTWPRHTLAGHDPDGRLFYWDQRPAVLSGGRLLDVFWTFDRQTGQYLAIHARESLDAGRSWSDLWDTGVPGQPAPPVELTDGRLVMVYVDRTAAPAICVRMSGDGGRSWPAETQAVIHEARHPQSFNKSTMQDAWAEMARFSLGLPHTSALPGNRVLVVYYSGADTDHTDIHWAVLR